MLLATARGQGPGRTRASTGDAPEYAGGLRPYRRGRMGSTATSAQPLHAATGSAAGDAALAEATRAIQKRVAQVMRQVTGDLDKPTPPAAPRDTTTGPATGTAGGGAQAQPNRAGPGAGTTLDRPSLASDAVGSGGHSTSTGVRELGSIMQYAPWNSAVNASSIWTPRAAEHDAGRKQVSTRNR